VALPVPAGSDIQVTPSLAIDLWFANMNSGKAKIRPTSADTLLSKLSESKVSTHELLSTYAELLLNLKENPALDWSQKVYLQAKNRLLNADWINLKHILDIRQIDKNGHIFSLHDKVVAPLQQLIDKIVIGQSSSEDQDIMDIKQAISDTVSLLNSTITPEDYRQTARDLSTSSSSIIRNIGEQMKTLCAAAESAKVVASKPDNSIIGRFYNFFTHTPITEIAPAEENKPGAKH
jgi:hypothetical protein